MTKISSILSRKPWLIIQPLALNRSTLLTGKLPSDRFLELRDFAGSGIPLNGFLHCRLEIVSNNISFILAHMTLYYALNIGCSESCSTH